MVESNTELRFYGSGQTIWYNSTANGGAWNGTNPAGAINSSLAASTAWIDGVGYGVGSQAALATIGGFPIAAADTLIRYTNGGDANLDGKIDIDDYGRIDSNVGISIEIFRGNVSCTNS